MDQRDVLFAKILSSLPHCIHHSESEYGNRSWSFFCRSIKENSPPPGRLQVECSYLAHPEDRSALVNLPGSYNTEDPRKLRQ